MKENFTNAILQPGGGGTITVATASTEQLVSPRLQSNQLACKENMVGQTLTATTSSSHPMTRSRRHQLQQQQQAVCALQCTEMEVLSDCISTVGVADAMVTSTYGGGSMGAMAVGGGVLPVVAPPMDCTNTVNSLTAISGGGFGGAAYSSVNAPPQVSKPKLQEMIGYEYHQTNTCTAPPSDGIQMLQGGSLHITQQPQPPQVPVLGFGMGTFTPLPKLQWARSTDLWRRMRAKDIARVAPETELRLQHPGILPSMRIILFDWMMEVSSVITGFLQNFKL